MNKIANGMNRILLEADFVDSVSRKPYEKPWQFRAKNQFLVEKSDVMLLFYDTEKGRKS